MPPSEAPKSSCTCDLCAVRRILGVNDGATPDQAEVAVHVLTLLLGELLVFADGKNVGAALSNIVETRNKVIRQRQGGGSGLANAEVAGHG